jgi:hypothetical protein
MTDVLCCNERGILCLCSVCVVVRVFKQGSEIWMDARPILKTKSERETKEKRTKSMKRAQFKIKARLIDG